jgi:hypothetical protein
MPRLDTGGGALAIFVITTLAIMGGMYAIDCLHFGACR